MNILFPVVGWERLMGTPWSRATSCTWFVLTVLGLPAGGSRGDKLFRIMERPELRPDEVRRGDVILWNKKSADNM